MCWDDKITHTAIDDPLLFYPFLLTLGLPFRNMTSISQREIKHLYLFSPHPIPPNASIKYKNPSPSTEMKVHILCICASFEFSLALDEVCPTEATGGCAQ